MITKLPTHTATSLGVPKIDQSVPPDTEHYISASEYNALVDAVIEACHSIGLVDGTTPASLEARIRELLVRQGALDASLSTCVANSGLGQPGEFAFWLDSKTLAAVDTAKFDTETGQLTIRGSGTHYGKSGLRIDNTGSGASIVLQAMGLASSPALYLTTPDGTPVPLTVARWENPHDGSHFYAGYRFWWCDQGRFGIATARDDAQLGIRIEDPTRIGVAIRMHAAQTTDCLAIETAVGSPVFRVTTEGAVEAHGAPTSSFHVVRKTELDAALATISNLEARISALETP